MKSSFFRLTSLLVVLAFAAACGKSGSSGGSSRSNSYNNVSTSGSAAQTNLLGWYNSSSEGSLPSTAIALRQVTRSVRAISANNGCHTQKLWIFGSIDLCASSNIGGGSASDSQEMVQLIASGNKSTGNAKLTAALAPVSSPGTNGLYLMNITQRPNTQNNGSIFTLTFVNVNQKTVTHVIDSGLNSRLNPVYTNDQVNGQESSLKSTFPGIYQ